MGKEDFRPKSKLVENEDLARKMAEVSDKQRTQEAQLRKAAAKPLTRLEKVFPSVIKSLSGLSPREQREKYAKRAEDYGQMAEHREDIIEIEAEVYREAEGLDDEELKTFRQQTFQSLTAVEENLRELNPGYFALTSHTPRPEDKEKIAVLRREYERLKIKLSALVTIAQSRERRG